MKAMVIEDDRANNDLFVEALTECGYSAHGFINAEDAMVAFHPGSYQLVTLDLSLPGINGAEFCRWLRRQEGGEVPYVLVITGRTEPEDLEDILRAGANDFLSKPLTPAALLMRLAIVEAQRKQRSAASTDEVADPFALVWLNVDAPLLMLTASPPTGYVIQANPAASRLWQTAADDLEGLSWSELLALPGANVRLLPPLEHFASEAHELVVQRPGQVPNGVAPDIREVLCRRVEWHGSRAWLLILQKRRLPSPAGN